MHFIPVPVLVFVFLTVIIIILIIIIMLVFILEKSYRVTTTVPPSNHPTTRIIKGKRWRRLRWRLHTLHSHSLVLLCSQNVLLHLTLGQGQGTIFVNTASWYIISSFPSTKRNVIMLLILLFVVTLLNSQTLRTFLFLSLSLYVFPSTDRIHISKILCIFQTWLLVPMKVENFQYQLQFMFFESL